MADQPLTPLRVCLAGTFDPDFSRNRKLARLLEISGHRVDTARVELWGSDRVELAGRPSPTLVLRAAVAYARLGWRLARATRPDVYLVGHPGWFDVPMVKLVAWCKGRPVVLDLFVGLYDTVVSDRSLLAAASGKARLLGWVDRLAVRLATRVLVDTPAQRDFFARTTDGGRFGVVWVGASGAEFTPQSIAPEPNLVVFYGTFIPLQGVDTIIRAAGLLAERGVRFVLIGDGQDKGAATALATELGLSNVEFVGAVGPADLVSQLARAALCLGIFGTSGKAGRVIPHKVFDSVAMARPTLSGETAGLRTGFTADEVAGCRVGEPAALAQAIGDLLDHPDRADRLASAGHRRFLDCYTDDRLAELLDQELRKAHTTSRQRQTGTTLP